MTLTILEPPMLDDVFLGHFHRNSQTLRDIIPRKSTAMSDCSDHVDLSLLLDTADAPPKTGSPVKHAAADCVDSSIEELARVKAAMKLHVTSFVSYDVESGVEGKWVKYTTYSVDREKNILGTPGLAPFKRERGLPTSYTLLANDSGRWGSVKVYDFALHAKDQKVPEWL